MADKEVKSFTQQLMDAQKQIDATNKRTAPKKKKKPSNVQTYRMNKQYDNSDKDD